MNAPTPGTPANPLRLTPVSSIKSESLDWLWKGYAAREKLTMLCGEPGVGKSLVAVNVGARHRAGWLRAAIPPSYLSSKADVSS